MPGIGSHEIPNEGKTNSWITPKYIIDDLGPFDLDPCACIDQPWPCAKKSFNKIDDGFNSKWEGNIWLNPPYGPHTGKWLNKLAKHGKGIALVFARTDTKFFINEVWGRASGILFISGRLQFYKQDGTIGKGNSGGPSVLISYGRFNKDKLKNSNIKGAFIDNWKNNTGISNKNEQLILSTTY